MDVEKLIPDAEVVVPKLTVLWFTLSALLGVVMLVNATSGLLVGFSPCG